MNGWMSRWGNGWMRKYSEDADLVSLYSKARLSHVCLCLHQSNFLHQSTLHWTRNIHCHIPVPNIIGAQ